jgi:hypothetical protein
VFVPFNVNTPTPALDKEADPDRTPPNVTALGFVIETFDASAPRFVKINAPVLVVSPNVNVPDNEYPFANVRSFAGVTPLLMSVPPVMVKVPAPNPELFPTRTVPELMETPPLNVFTPLNVVAPVPARTNPPDPLIAPLRTPVVSVPFTVSEKVCKFTAPLPVKLPIVSFAPNFKVPGELTVTDPASAIAAPPFKVSVPPLTVVVPVYVFAPANVNSPDPAFVQFPPPLTTPFHVTTLSVVTVAPAVIAPVPLKLNAPLLVA